MYLHGTIYISYEMQQTKIVTHSARKKYHIEFYKLSTTKEQVY
jgi:hypothetical protein